MKLVDYVEKLTYRYESYEYIAYFRHNRLLWSHCHDDNGRELDYENKKDYKILKMIEQDYKMRKKIMKNDLTK